MVKIFMLIAVSVALFCVYPIAAQSQPPIQESPQQNYRQPTESTQKQPNENKITGKPFISSPIQNIANPQNQEPHPDGKQDHPWYEIFSNHPTDWLLALFTGFLALFTYRLWKATMDLWEVSQEQSRDMKTSIVIAKEAANAAKISTDNLIVAERAHIFAIVKPKINREINIKDGGFEEYMSLEGVLYLRNHGKTPAIIKEIAFYGYKYDSPINDKLVVMWVHYPVESFIGHGEEFEEDRHSFLMTEDEWGGLITIKPRLYIYCVGYVKYITIFGQEHCHGFCWEYDGPSDKFVLSPNIELNYNT